MPNKKVNGNLFRKMVTNGAIHLKNNYREVDHLNVFPVPDGDTGTNMQMTMMAGVKEVNDIDSESIVDVSKILSRGLLMGARGNSGVILSQYFRGVYSEINKIEKDTVSIKEFIQALVGGYQMAYRAVMDPVEGTILTVVRESAERVLKEQAKLSSIEEVLKVYLTQAKETLQKTPDLLPVLKEAGVVDSGGAGFIKIVEGMIMALDGNMLTESEEFNKYGDLTGAHALGDVDIKYAYCTEFIVSLNNKDTFDVNPIRNALEQMGDSLVVVQDEELLKVHVHTNQPGVALTLAQKFGEILTVKIENMRQQHTSIMTESKQPTPPKMNKPKSKYGVIAVCQGDGIKEAFTELGVDIIIDGGQTMNPSTEDFVNAVSQLNCENIIILPNNSNVILSAEQTIELCPDHVIRVLKTKSIAQGYASLMIFDPTQELNTNIDSMMDVVGEMKSGEVTYAVRDTQMNDVEIAEGDFIGISKGKICVSTPKRIQTTCELIDSMVDENSEILTIFYGVDVNDDEIAEIRKYIETTFADVELEIIDGGQDVYSYIIAVE